MDEMWVSKYALSGGIKKKIGQISASGKYFCVDGEFSSYAIGKAAHVTEQEAVSAAEVMKIKRIDSLKKQITKLEKLRF